MWQIGFCPTIAVSWNQQLTGEDAMHRLAYLALLTALVTTSLFGADASERKFIRAGMSEGEVLMKIGKPDSESSVTGGGATVEVKKWIYLPTPADQQTITTITIGNGKVINVDRQVTR
jgi:hypothetical protein